MRTSSNFPYTWPRHYAAEIIDLPDKDARRAALLKVPEEWRDWVFELVRDHFDKKRCLLRYQRSRP